MVQVLVGVGLCAYIASIVAWLIANTLQIFEANTINLLMWHKAASF